MDFLTKNISYLGRRSYGSESTSNESSTSVAGGSGGGGTSGRFIPYSVDEEGNWVVENGYSTDESGNTVFGADIILKGSLVVEGESSAYGRGESGQTGGSEVEWEQLLLDGVQIASIVINNEETAVYAPAGGGGGGSYSPGSGISINSNNVISLSQAAQNGIASGASAYTAVTSHMANSSIHVTSSQKTTWNNKQDAISDLSTIRANAASGKTAYDSLGNYYTSAQTNTQIDNAGYNILQDVANNYTSQTTFNSHTGNSSIHITTAQVGTQISTALQPYFTSAQTDSRYVNVMSAQTISGTKTFSAEKTYIGGDLIVSGSILSLKDVSAYGTSDVTSAPSIIVQPIYSAGTLVANITVNGVTYPIYAPTTDTTTPTPVAP